MQRHDYHNTQPQDALAHPDEPRVQGSSSSALAISVSSTSQATVAIAGRALSATVMPTLESAQIYEPVDDRVRVMSDGHFVPISSRKRKFPRALSRLRDRLQTLEDRLQLDVNALKQEIADLKTQSTLLETKRMAQHARVEETISNAVCAFFEAFTPATTADHEIESVEVVSADQDTSSNADSEVRGDHDNLPHRQRFIESFTRSDLMFGSSVNGREELILQWKRYSECHSSLIHSISSFSLHGPLDEPVVIVVGSLHGYLTKKALDIVYPHFRADSSLGDRLVDSYIEYPTRTVFHFDSMGKIVHLDMTVDFVRALQMTLGDLQFVELILRGSLIRENGCIGPSRE